MRVATLWKSLSPQIFTLRLITLAKSQWSSSDKIILRLESLTLNMRNLLKDHSVRKVENHCGRTTYGARGGSVQDCRKCVNYFSYCLDKSNFGGVGYFSSQSEYTVRMTGKPSPPEREATDHVASVVRLTVGVQLSFPFPFIPGPQPMEWCLPHLQWVAPPQLTYCGNSLTDMPRDLCRLF